MARSLMGVIAYGLNDDAHDTTSVMLRSVDQGKTWKYLSTIADDPGGKLGGFRGAGHRANEDRPNRGRLAQSWS